MDGWMDVSRYTRKSTTTELRIQTNLFEQTILLERDIWAHSTEIEFGLETHEAQQGTRQITLWQRQLRLAAHGIGTRQLMHRHVDLRSLRDRERHHNSTTSHLSRHGTLYSTSYSIAYKPIEQDRISHVDTRRIEKREMKRMCAITVLNLINIINLAAIRCVSPSSIQQHPDAEGTIEHTVSGCCQKSHHDRHSHRCCGTATSGAASSRIVHVVDSTCYDRDADP